MNETIQIKDLDVVDIIYKFREYTALSIQTFLESKIYIPSANDFNDPLDSKLPFRYDEKELTEENIYKKSLLISKQTFPHLKESEHQANAYKNHMKGLLFDEEHLSKFDKENYDRTCREFGIFCTTPDCENFLMWSYYSNSHRGFAIGYDTKKLLSANIFGMGGSIIYDDKFPSLPLFPSEDDHHFIGLFFTKSDKWEHEKEYRLIHRYKTGKVQKIPIDAIAEIILGVNFPEDEKMKFMIQINSAFPEARVYQMELTPLKFDLHKKLIYDPMLQLFHKE